MAPDARPGFKTVSVGLVAQPAACSFTSSPWPRPGLQAFLNDLGLDGGVRASLARKEMIQHRDAS